MELKEGQIVNARVSGMQPYGAFVEMEDGKSGLVFIEDLSVVRIKSPKDRVKIGQEIQCKVKSIDKKTGKIIKLRNEKMRIMAPCSRMLILHLKSLFLRGL